VLRDGRNAGALERGEISHEAMVTLMVGRTLEDLYVRGRGAREPRYFEVEGLRTAYRPRHAVTFDVARGEILGLAGLVGAGRSELVQTLFGVDRPLAGSIRLAGQVLRLRGPRDAIAAGIYLAPEDRRRTGLVLEMSVRENITLAGLRRLSNWGLVPPRREVEAAQRQAEALRVRAPGLETRVSALSGGNQQKVVLAKWLALEPRVILLDEPTRGIDVGAKAEIYRLMRDLADRGVAIVMVSSDMEEVLGVSDRIAVMHEGAIAGLLDRDRFGEEAIMRLAVGRSAA
jgi:ribose transport system ATP-binding protein